MPATMSKTADEIDEMFEIAMEKEGDIREFVESLHEQWENKSYLTEKQIAALQRVVDNGR